MKTTGILTLATGSEHYIKLALNLGKSIALTNKHIPIAIVTDIKSNSNLYTKYKKQFSKVFDAIIEVDHTIGNGFRQKVHIYQYSPYKKTLFIDSDCLVLGNIDFIFKAFNNQPYNVQGTIKRIGNWGGVLDIQHVITQLSLPYLIQFNGGIYYFEKSDSAEKIFKDAQTILSNYDQLNLYSFRGDIADEPILSIALSMNKVNPILDDEKKWMYTPIGIEGPLHIDALTGKCTFIKNEERVCPTIMHFGGPTNKLFHYKRETIKIKLLYAGYPRIIIRTISVMFFNLPYIFFVFIYRLMKRIVKGTELKSENYMPMYHFE